MDDKFLWGALITSAGWLIAFRSGLTVGRTRAAEDLASRRQQLATALLVELRVLEAFLRRIRIDAKPLESHWQVPSNYLDAKLGSLEILPVATLREVMEFHGILQDITAYRNRHPTSEPPTEFQNWFVRLKATFALQRIHAAKKCLLADGGLLPPADPGPTVHHPALPPLPERAFPEYNIEYDEDGDILPPQSPS